MELKGSWTLPKNDGIGPQPRGGHASVAVGNRLLVFGGADRGPVTMNDLWVLELVDGAVSWTRIFATVAGGGEILPRSGATLTAAGANVYLFGGQDPMTGGAFNDVLVLDTLKWQWADLEVKGGRPPPRHSHCTGLLQNNCLLVFGGAGLQGTLGDVWIFNVGQRTWARPNVGGYAPPGREMHTGLMVGPHRMLVFGGRGMDGRILCDAALLDAGSMAWVKQEATPFARCAHAAALAPLADPSAAASDSSADTSTQHVLIHGGFAGDAVAGDILLLDAATLRMSPLQPTLAGPTDGPAARFAHCAARLQAPDGKQVMVVFGGVNPQEDLADVAVWVPAGPPPSQASSADTTMHVAAATTVTAAPTTSGQSACPAEESQPMVAAAAEGAAGEQTSAMLVDSTGKDPLQGSVDTVAAPGAGGAVAPPQVAASGGGA